MGFSMGAAVVGALLPHRPDTAAVLLLHTQAEIPATARAGLPVQLHVADPDPFVPDPAGWHARATSAGAAAEVFTYPGAGHFYLDADLPDHDEWAAALTWRRVLDALTTVRTTPRR
jgi:dienelactone hydrolase